MRIIFLSCIVFSCCLPGLQADYSSTYLFSGICWHNIKHLKGKVFTEHVEGSGYPRGQHCKATVISPDDRYRVLVLFESFDIYYSDGCTVDYVRIYDGANIFNTDLLTEQPLCGNSTQQSYKSTGKSITVEFMSADQLPSTTGSGNTRNPHGFELIFNVFLPYEMVNDGNNETAVTPGQFCCESGDVCIDKSLVCDDFYNCPDNSDEADTVLCLAKKTGLDEIAKTLGLPLQTVIGAAVGSILFLILIIIIIVVICCCCCCRKNKKEVKEIHRFSEKRLHSGSKSGSSHIIANPNRHYHGRPRNDVIGSDTKVYHYYGKATSDSGVSNADRSRQLESVISQTSNVTRTQGALYTGGVAKDSMQGSTTEMYAKPKPRYLQKKFPPLDAKDDQPVDNSKKKDEKVATGKNFKDKRSISLQDEGFETASASSVRSRPEIVYYKLYDQQEERLSN